MLCYRRDGLGFERIGQILTSIYLRGDKGKMEEEKKSKVKRLTIRVPEELERKIREEAARRGTNLNQMMLHMLTKYLKNLG